MNREEYTQRVLDALGRLTPKEISAVRTEIEGHIEDHMESLLELGYDETLAEERTMAAMGDPEEVGRELNKQYPIRWQILKDIATAFTGILLVLALFLGSSYSDFWQSLVVRFDPVQGSGDEPMGWTATPNVHLTAGNDVVRAYQVSVWQSPSGPVATVYLCAYDHIPGGVVSTTLEKTGVLTLKNPRGEEAEVAAIKTNGCYSAKYYRAYVPLEDGDTHMTLHYTQYGQTSSCEIPLPEVTP